MTKIHVFEPSVFCAQVCVAVSQNAGNIYKSNTLEIGAKSAGLKIGEYPPVHEHKYGKILILSGKYSKMLDFAVLF